jgi:hypothetical protein
MVLLAEAGERNRKLFVVLYAYGGGIAQRASLFSIAGGGI